MSRRLAVGIVAVMVAGMGLAGFAVFGLGIGDKTLERVVDEVWPTENAAAPTTTTTTVPVYPEPSPRPPLPAVEAGSVTFSCDFTVACPLDQFVQFRDGFVVSATEGRADHAPMPGATFDEPLCTAPEETRAWSRIEPHALTYRCIPMGNLDAAHQMSVAPNTSGYSFTGSAPDLVFEDVERISFQVNMTSAGSRNFWEVAVIPADETWVDGMPCIPALPCNDAYDYDDIGAVGFGNQAHQGSGFQIGTPSRPDGHRYDNANRTELPDGSVQFLPCDDSPYCASAVVHRAQPDVRSRHQVVIEDREDGLWFGQVDESGVMHWVTVEGEHLPDGPVRVVLKFHGYTPTKDGNGPGFDENLSASEHAFTWHWDDFEVVAGSSVPSADYYGDLNPERFTTAGSPACLAFAQGQRDERNRTVLPLISCPEGTDLDDVRTGPIGELSVTG